MCTNIQSVLSIYTEKELFYLYLKIFLFQAKDASYANYRHVMKILRSAGHAFSVKPTCSKEVKPTNVS